MHDLRLYVGLLLTEYIYRRRWTPTIHIYIYIPPMEYGQIITMIYLKVLPAYIYTYTSTQSRCVANRALLAAIGPGAG